MQLRIVDRPGGLLAEDQHEQATHDQPDIADQQVQRDEAGEAGAAHGLARNVEPQQPDRDQQERQAHDPRAEIGQRGEAEHEQPDDVDPDQCEEGAHRPARKVRQAGHLQPLARDGQHQVAAPPPDDLEDRPAGQPEHVAGRPQHRAEAHRVGERRRLAADDLAEDRDQRDAAGGQQPGAGGRPSRLVSAPNPERIGAM